MAVVAGAALVAGRAGAQAASARRARRAACGVRIGGV
jgi:hypothetical protein